MKIKLIRILSMLVCLALCASLSVINVFSSGTADLEDEALLLRVDDLSQAAQNPQTGASYSQSVSLSSISGDTNQDNYYSYGEGSMSTNAFGVGATRAYGGQTNLKLDETSKYTVSYMVSECTSGITSGAGLRISFASCSDSIGVYMQSTSACLAWGTQTVNGYSNYVSYTDEMKVDGSVFSSGGYAEVAVEIDGTVCCVYINGVLLIKENINNPSNSAANEGINKSYMSETLSLVWHEYQLSNSSVEQAQSSTSFKNIRIYDGLLNGEAVRPIANDGELLLQVKDLSSSAQGAYTGVKYSPYVKATDGVYAYTDGVMEMHNVGKTTRTVGGTTNLALSEDTKYTVTYMMSETSASGGGLRIAYETQANSVGVYMSKTQACLQWGNVSSASGYSGMKSFTNDMKQDGTVFCNDGYAAVGIEIDGSRCSVYINGKLLLTEDISTPSNSGAASGIARSYMSKTVSLVWHEYHNAPTEQGEMTTSFKNLEIYSGLLFGGAVSPKADGTLLLEVDDLSKTAENELTGAEYRSGLASTQSFYSFSEGISTTTGTGTTGTKTYGGSTNLVLSSSTKYTVTYMVSESSASGGMRISYSANASSIGVYMSSTQACLQWGNVSGAASYSKMQSYTAKMKNGGNGIYYHDGYAKVDIEIDGLKIYIYINDVLLLSEDISAPSNTAVSTSAANKYVSSTLSLVWHEYHSEAYGLDDTLTSFKDIRLYSGCLHREAYDIRMLAVDVGTVADGSLPIRFSATGNIEWYGLVGFEIEAVYNGAAHAYDYKTSKVFRIISEANGLCSLTADEGDYVFAYTLLDVPADITVTFNVKPFAYENGTRFYGNTEIYTISNGLIVT